jgi:Effector-associated domain 1
VSAPDSLDGQQQGRLIEALMSAYPTRDDVDMLLEISLSRSFDQIAGTGGLENCVFKLVRAAMKEGWLPDLINAAVARQPRNAKLIAWVESDGQISGAEITATETPGLAPYEKFKSMNFDLDELHKEIRRVVKQPPSPVLGFVIRYSDDVFVKKLCDWFESNIGNTKCRESLNLWPSIGSVSERLRGLARYKGDLASSNVLCTVLTQGVPGEIVTEFWSGVHREFAGLSRLLLLIFASDETATLPADMIELPYPYFTEQDIDLWALDMVHLHKWRLELADAWTELLCAEAKDEDNKINVRRLYQVMDDTIDQVRYEASNFKQLLEGRIGHANPPQA